MEEQALGGGDSFSVMIYYTSTGISTEQEKTEVKEDRKIVRKRRSEVVIVKPEGRMYEDLIREAKDSEEGGIEKLKEEIMNQLVTEGVDVRKGGDALLTIQVKGLQITVTWKYVENRIARAIGRQDARIGIEAMWPAFGKSQNADVELLREDVETLLSIGRIRIGWSFCVVTEKTILRRCIRCWGFGHLAKEYEEVDRRALCLRCAKEGHKVRIAHIYSILPSVWKRRTQDRFGILSDVQRGTEKGKYNESTERAWEH